MEEYRDEFGDLIDENGIPISKKYREMMGERSDWPLGPVTDSKGRVVYDPAGPRGGGTIMFADPSSLRGNSPVQRPISERIIDVTPPEPQGIPYESRVRSTEGPSFKFSGEEYNTPLITGYGKRLALIRPETGREGAVTAYGSPASSSYLDDIEKTLNLVHSGEMSETQLKEKIAGQEGPVKPLTGLAKHQADWEAAQSAIKQTAERAAGEAASRRSRELYGSVEYSKLTPEAKVKFESEIGNTYRSTYQHAENQETAKYRDAFYRQTAEEAEKARAIAADKREEAANAKADAKEKAVEEKAAAEERKAANKKKDEERKSDLAARKKEYEDRMKEQETLIKEADPEDAAILRLGKKMITEDYNKKRKALFNETDSEKGEEPPKQEPSPIGPEPLKSSANQPPQGYKQAPDGKYYIPDPARPGKYLRWKG